MSDDLIEESGVGGDGQTPEQGQNIFTKLGLDKASSEAAPAAPQEGGKPKGRNLFKMVGVEPKIRMERTWGEAAGDTGLQLLEGANSLVGAIPSLIAPDSDVAQFYKNNADYLRGEQSPVMQRKMKAAEAEIAKADPDSIVDQAMAAAGAYGTDPALAARLVVTTLPSMIPSVGAAKLAQAAALARGATAAKAAGTATTAAGGVNAALTAGSARGDAYDEIKGALADSGMRSEDIEAAAIDGSVMPAIVGGAVGALSGKIGLESAIVSGGLAKGGIRAALAKGGQELAGEQIEEITPKVATNYAASEHDDRSLSRNIGRTAVETAIGSGPSTGIAAAMAGLNKQADEPASTPSAQPQASNVPTPAPATPAATGAAPATPAAPPAPPAQGQPAGAQNQAGQQPAPAASPVAQSAAPSPNDLEAEQNAATTRLAELEISAQSTGLTPEEQRERMLLVHRLDELEEMSHELPPEIGGDAQAAPAQGQAQQQAPKQASQIAPEDLPDAGMDATPEPNFDHVKTWPQFVVANGYKVEGLKKGTPDWVALQSGWNALKTKRAGLQPQGNGQQAAPKQEIQNRDRSRPASVMQMQAMAQNPDYGRLGISRTPESGAPMVFAEGDVVMGEHSLGREDVAVMSDGQRVPFKYAVMEAADVHPSNFADGSVNPQFDAKVLGTVKALNNGRTAGVRAAYERGTADKYKQELMADESMHGVSAQAIAGMQSPVLVRLYSESQNQHNMGVKSQSQALGLSAAEQAATDAHLMDAQMLDLFESGELDGQGNQDFVRGFVGRLQAAGQDVAEMMDAGGRVSPKGVQRLQAAMVHKAYDDGDLVETMFGSTDNDIKAIGEALKSVAGEWAHMRHMVASGAVNPQVDVTGNVLQAVRLIQQARRDRSALVDLVNQVDIESGSTVADLTVGMLRLMYGGEHMTRARGRDAVAEGLRQYVTAALATSAQGGDMFGEVVGPEQIVTALTGVQVEAQNTQPPASTEASKQESTKVNEPAQPTNPASADDIARTTTSGHTAGSGADAAGAQEQRPAASAAGARDDETSGRGQGQDAQSIGQQQSGAGDQAATESGDGRVNEPQAQEPALQSYTAEEIRAQQEAQEAADKAKKEADDKAAKEERARKDKADIDARQQASADDFQLGQDPMDSLAGQKSVFDDPAPAPKQETARAESEPQTGATIAEEREIGQALQQYEDPQAHHLFDPVPKKDQVQIHKKASVYHEQHGWMTPEEAKQKLKEWKAHAAGQARKHGNENKVVLSLFDRTGSWSQPWQDAGYNVWRFDIQNDPEMGDVNNFSTEFFNDWFSDFDGQDVYAVLAACPCTDFASSGARHFAAKDADGRTVASVELVEKTMATIEHFKPSVWALENPVGRIERLTSLPNWRASFDPNHFGDPYTKKTLLWGRFDGDMPIAPVEPTEGSKMHQKYGGKSLATKNARSITPEGFAYSFFMANNAADHPMLELGGKFDRLPKASLQAALDAGLSVEDISRALEDNYFDMRDGDALQSLSELVEKSKQTSKQDSKQDKPSREDLDAMFDELLAEETAATAQAAPVAQGNTTSTGHKEGDKVALGAGRAEVVIKKIRDDGTVAVVMASGSMNAMTDAEFAQRYKRASEKQAQQRGPTTSKTLFTPSIKYRDPETGATWSGRGKPPLWIQGKDRAQFEVPTLESKEESKQATKAEKPKSVAAQKREAAAAKVAELSAKYLNGAKVGDTITPSKDFEYLTGGKPMLIEKISDRGEVYVKDPARESRTSFDASIASAHKVSFEVTPAPTVGQSLASAASNTAAGLTAAIDGLGALFGGGGKFNSGLAFDEETYAKAKPLFAQAVANLGEAGKDLRTAMRAVIKMVNDKFGPQVTANMKPYVVQYIQEISEKENDVPSAPASLERDSEKPAPVSNDGGAVQRDRSDTAQDDGQASGRTGQSNGGGQQDDTSVSVDAAVMAGKRSDQRLHHGGTEARPESGTTGADYFDGVPTDSRDGVQVDGATNPQIAALAKDAKPSGGAQRNASDASKQGSKRESKQQDIAYELGGELHAQDVRDAVPMLLPGQVDDVVKTEVAFSKPDVHGMLLTNGTGTGKTFSGLGVAKRFANAGKSNILMLAPDDKIAADWIESATRLGLTVTQLADTKDAGAGVVVTTYANLGENNALASRQWDLVVPDEAHTLMSNQEGEQTKALERLRALTFHPRGLWSRMRMVHADDYAKAQELRERIEEEKASGNQPEALKLETQLEVLEGKLQAAHEAMKHEFANAEKDGKRSKMLALSATPFAYEKNIEWAEGYLFSYDSGRRDDQREFRGYNEGGNKEQFFMQHFGYRMRYNKLTEPDANVDRGLMQRQFNTWLKQRGVLSTRLLDVPADYDRRFVLFDSAIGNRIDEALGYIAEQARENDAYKILQKAVDKSLGYQQRRYLLEAMKAQEAVGMVRAHMAMGRKVVVFHDFIKGGGTNPFDIEVSAFAETQEQADMLRDAMRDFDKKFGDLKRANLQNLPSPIELFSKEFPELLLVNGQVKPKRNVLKAYKTFNDDNNGPQVMLVQSAKDKGWSGHDTTGKHQRVLINLGLPTAPTKAIQQEGRIYRTGQVSDAIMRYLNTGTSWERIAFATTIATRAATAENLALGELARSLQDSFIEAFEESAPWEPGHEGEGKGGKEGDRARNNVVSEFDRAKTLYWAQQKKTSKTKAKEGTDYFATPEPLGLKMVQWAGVVDGEDALEPSAGHGAIARWFPETARRTMVELSPELRSRLSLAGFKNTDRIVAGAFEDLDISNKYDTIVMNPPFGTAGRMAVDHMAKAYRHLREGGRMVALLPVGSADQKLENWLYEKADKADKDGNTPYTKPELHRTADVLLPTATFGRAGTGVMTRIVVIDKLAKGEEPTHAHRTVDLRDVTDANELFERIEHLDMPERAKKKQAQATNQAQAAHLKELASTQASAQESTEANNQQPEESDKPMLKREGRAWVEHFTVKGKRLTGVIFHGSKEEAMRYDPYTLAKDGGWLIRGKHVIDGEGDSPRFMRVPMNYATGKRHVAKLPRAEAMSEAQKVVDRLMAKWKNAAPTVVAYDMNDEKIPVNVRRYNDEKVREAKEQGKEVGAPRGFHYKGVVYILAEENQTPAQVMQTMFHEHLGHVGLGKLFGEGLTKILKQIREARPAEVQDIAYRYGLDLSIENDANMAAEEVLTHMAQELPSLGFVQRAIAQVRTWLRNNVPMARSMSLTDAEIINSFLLPARRHIENEASKRDNAAWSNERIDPQLLRVNVSAKAFAAAVQGTSSSKWQEIKQWLNAGSWDEFIYKWQDRFIDLKRIQASIVANGGTVSEATDGYTGEELFHKRLAKRVNNFLRDELNPLLRELHKTGVSLHDFERFLHARHAAEANQVLAERNPSQAIIDTERKAAEAEVRRLDVALQQAKRSGTAVLSLQKSMAAALEAKRRWDGAQAFRGTEDERLSLSGMTDLEATNILNGYPADVRAKLDALGLKVDAINNGTLDVLQNYGLMDPAALQAWRQTYKHYVPLHRDEAHPDSKAHPIGQGFSTRGDAAKQRTGSNEKVTNIFAHIAMQREAALTRGEKNNVAKRLYTMAAQNPDPELWSLDVPKKRVIDDKTGLVKTVPDLAALNADNVLMVRIGGKDKHLLFNPKNERAVRLGVAMRNLDAMELDRFTRLMGKITRWFASVNTQYNPIFSIFNFARDLQGAMLQLSSTELKGQEREILKGVAGNMRHIWRELRNTRKSAGSGSSDWAKLWEQMQLDGGTTGFRDLYADPADRAESLQKAIDQMGQGAVRSAPRKLILETLSDMNETLEATTRLAVYKIALDQGLTRQRAASIAKNITVNFNRKGRNMSVVGSYYAFMNAAIQGSVRLGQTLKGPRGKQIIMGGVMLGMLSAFSGQMIMGGDGADDEWAKIPEFVKERSVIIPLSGKDYLAIPMPLGFHVFPNIGRKLVEFGFHDDPHTSRMSHVADLMLASVNAFNPLGGMDNFMQMLAPTPFDPVAALMENKDWTGRSIYREQTSHLDPKPGHQMAKESTTRFAVSLSRGLNWATGGNDWQRGALSLNPDAIEYVFGQVTGGVGRELVKAGNSATALATGDELAMHKVPLVGRVVGNTRGVNGQSDGFYSNLQRINVAEAEAKGRIQEGESMDSAIAKAPLAQLGTLGGMVQKRVKELTELRNRILKSDAPEKSAQVKEINAEIERAMYQLNSAADEVARSAAR